MRRIALLLYSLLSIIFTACQSAPNLLNGSSVPMLTVRESTNCRTGPGTDYDIVFTYPPGTKLAIAGRDEPGNFWLVKSDKSPTGTCWMWGGSVDVTGNPQAVASVVPSPVPTGTSIGPGPRALSIVNWDYSCSNGTLTFTVNWKSRFADETGFRIFRNGEPVAELPANSTTYTDTLSAGQNVEYYIQVYGPSGSENSSVMRVGC